MTFEIDGWFYINLGVLMGILLITGIVIGEYLETHKVSIYTKIHKFKKWVNRQ